MYTTKTRTHTTNNTPKIRLFVVTQNGHSSQGPVLRGLDRSQKQWEDIGQVGTSWFFVHRTLEQMHGAFLVIFPGCGGVDGVHVDHWHGGKEDLGQWFYKFHISFVPASSVQKQSEHVNPT